MDTRRISEANSRAMVDEHGVGRVMRPWKMVMMMMSLSYSCQFEEGGYRQ